VLSQKTEAETLCEELFGTRTKMEKELLQLRSETAGLRVSLLQSQEELSGMHAQMNEFKFVHHGAKF
jgi:hypothetical protein